MKQTRIRLVLAIVGTLIQEGILVAIVLLGLPRLGIYFPVWGLVLLMLCWAAFGAFLYIAGTKAMARKPLSLTRLVGVHGKVVTPLAPEGAVMIEGELWTGVAVNEYIEARQEIEVVAQNGLKLTVRRYHAAASLPR